MDKDNTHEQIVALIDEQQELLLFFMSVVEYLPEDKQEEGVAIVLKMQETRNKWGFSEVGENEE